MCLIGKVLKEQESHQPSRQGEASDFLSQAHFSRRGCDTWLLVPVELGRLGSMHAMCGKWETAVDDHSIGNTLDNQTREEIPLDYMSRGF